MIPQQLGLAALLVRFAGGGKVTSEDVGSEGTGSGAGGVAGGGTEFSERGARDTGGGRLVAVFQRSLHQWQTCHDSSSNNNGVEQLAGRWRWKMGKRYRIE